MQAQINNSAEIRIVQLPENGHFLNNPNLPVLLYKNVFEFDEGQPVSTIGKVLAGNNRTFYSLFV